MALKGWILSHVAATGICGSVIGGPGGTIGLRCTLLQRKNAIAFLRGLEIVSPWFRGVLENGHPLPGALGATVLPRPGDHDGICDACTIESVLWT
jgi:hypothetical protein